MAAVMGDREARAVLGVPSEASAEEIRLAFEKHAIALDAAGARADLDRVVGAYRTLAPDVARPPEAPPDTGRPPRHRLGRWPAVVVMLIALLGLAVGIGLVQARSGPSTSIRGSRAEDGASVPGRLGITPGTPAATGRPAAVPAPAEARATLSPVALATPVPVASAVLPSPTAAVASSGSRRGHPRGSPTPGT